MHIAVARSFIAVIEFPIDTLHKVIFSYLIFPRKIFFAIWKLLSKLFNHLHSTWFYCRQSGINNCIFTAVSITLLRTTSFCFYHQFFSYLQRCSSLSFFIDILHVSVIFAFTGYLRILLESLLDFSKKPTASSIMICGNSSFFFSLIYTLKLEPPEIRSASREEPNWRIVKFLNCSNRNKFDNGRGINLDCSENLVFGKTVSLRSSKPFTGHAKNLVEIIWYQYQYKRPDTLRFKQKETGLVTLIKNI